VLNVLITNIWLVGLGGTETSARELAFELKRRGHQPMVYSPTINQDTLEWFRGVPVVDNLADLPFVPDIIHGRHRGPVRTAMEYFPDVPVIFVSHSGAEFLSEYEMPEPGPRISRYVAVDEWVKEALVRRAGIPADRIRVIHNFVNTDRFLPREPLPEVPKKALVFSNYTFQDQEKKDRLQVIRNACEQTGLSLDVMGMGTDRYTIAPEKELVKYDIVFAKAKAALESLATGNAVILCDCLFGVGEMVNPENADAFLRTNFGLTRPFDEALLVREIRKYNPVKARETMELVRSAVGMSPAVDRWEALYREVLREYHAPHRRLIRWIDRLRTREKTPRAKKP
jgi:glycosyltransferase involved in cell wall biosynthesis